MLWDVDPTRRGVGMCSGGPCRCWWMLSGSDQGESKLEDHQHVGYKAEEERDGLTWAFCSCSSTSSSIQG